MNCLKNRGFASIGPGVQKRCQDACECMVSEKYRANNPSCPQSAPHTNVDTVYDTSRISKGFCAG